MKNIFIRFILGLFLVTQAYGAANPEEDDKRRGKKLVSFEEWRDNKDQDDEVRVLIDLDNPTNSLEDHLNILRKRCPRELVIEERSQPTPCIILEAYAQEIAEILRTNPPLTELSLGHSLLPSSVNDLLKSLTNNDTLRALRLYGDGDFSDKEGDEVKGMWCSLAELLSRDNCPLTHLTCTNMSVDNDLQEEKVKLTEAIGINGSLKELDLKGSDMGDEFIPLLIKALSSNTTLTSLSLYANSIGSEEAEELIKAVVTHPSLKEVNLGQNNISDPAIRRIEEIVRTENPHLSLRVDLSSQDWEDKEYEEGEED